MLGEKDIEKLNKFKLVEMFHPSEIALIDFIIENRRLPNYTTERSHYQVLLRLKKKLKKSKEFSYVVTDLFNTIDNVLVSNKLTGGDVS